MTPSKLHTFSNKCAKVVKAIVEIELGPISIPSLEYLLSRSIEEWIQECDSEKETIWNMVYKIPSAPVLEDPKKKKKKKKKKSLALDFESLGRTSSKKKSSKKKNPLKVIKKIKTVKK